MQTSSIRPKTAPTSESKTSSSRLLLITAFTIALSFIAASVLARPTDAALPMTESDTWDRPVFSSEFDGFNMVSLNNGEDMYILAGGGVTNPEHFYHYSVANDTWTQKQDLPCTPGDSTDMTYNVENNYIYALCGNFSQEFYRYSVASNNWTRMTDILQFPIDLMAIASTSSDDVYALYEGTMAHYSISGNSWTDKANYSGSLGYGLDMVYPGSGDFVYAVSPGSPPDFYRYSISGDSWVQMEDLPNDISFGGGLAYPGAGDYIYALGDEVFATHLRSLYRYSISGNSWDTLASFRSYSESGGSLVPYGDNDRLLACSRENSLDDRGQCFVFSTVQNTWLSINSLSESVNTGSSLSYQPEGEYIHVNPGGCGQDYYRYSITSNAWTTMTNFPDVFCEGSGVEYVNGYAYALPGDYIDSFHRLPVYPTVGDTWQSLTNPPQSVTSGTNLMYPGKGTDILVKFSTEEMYTYSTTSNSWTRLEDIPTSTYYGSSCYGEDGYVYSLRGANSNDFYRYSIDSDSWEQLEAAPISIDYNRSNLASDGSFVYLIYEGEATFHRYNISEDTWDTGAAFPASIGEAPFVLHPTSDSYYLYVLQGESTENIVSALFRYTLPLYQIANVDAGINITDVSGNNVETTGGYGMRNETLTITDSSNGNRISVVDVNVSSNPNWSSVSGESDSENGVAYIANLTSASGTASTHTLYTPVGSGDTRVRICPNATSLDDVTADCAGGVDFSENQTASVGGSSVTVTRGTVGSQEYWIASGVSGSGGISLSDELSETGSPAVWVIVIGAGLALAGVATKKILI